MNTYHNYYSVVARLGLGGGMLSAVADRFGAWGAPGQPHAVWGDWAHFTAYTAQVNSFLPAALAPALASLATVAELGLGGCLVLGLFVRPVALATAALMLLFALAMTLSFGPKPALDYSVWANVGGALLLSAAPGTRWRLASGPPTS